MLDRRLIGRESGFSNVRIDAARLIQFAHAIGETNPVYFDRAVARDAGYPDIPVPPTYVYCLESLAPPPGMTYADLGLAPETLLHAEQHFAYYDSLYAGDSVRLQMRIVDVFEKKNGTLQFLAIETLVTKPAGALAAKCRALFVVRAP